jgi:hypothetical protein
MAINVEDNVVSIAGHCPIDEAEPLFETLRGIEDPIFDLSQATTLHTAIVQLVLASSARIRGMPSDKVLTSCFRTCSLG